MNWLAQDRLLGAINLIYAATLLSLVGFVLPARHGLMDAALVTSGLVLLASGLGLMLRTGWAKRAAKLSGALVLLLGLLVTVGIILSIGFLHGIYGAVGEGGTAVLLVIFAITLPYFLIFPLVQLSWASRNPSLLASEKTDSSP